MYDITNYDSFNNVKRWLTEIDKYARENVNKLLVGNKVDLADGDGDKHPNPARAVAKDEGQTMADKLGIAFMEASAKTGQFVDTAFLVMANNIKAKMLQNSSSSSTGVDTSEKEKKGGCC